MRKLFARLALPFAALLLAAKASAFEITVDSIRYYVESNTSTTCSVTLPGTTKYSGDVVIPEKVTYNGRTLTVTAIGSNAFQSCDSLTSITIPNTVTSIGYWAFVGCTSLTEVVIPNSVTTISPRAFVGCTGLTSVTLGSSVSLIMRWAFDGCTNLKSIYSLNPVPPTAVDLWQLESQYLNVTVYVPQGSLAAYQSAEEWKECWNIVEIETAGIDGIGTNDIQPCVKAEGEAVVIEGSLGMEVKVFDTAGSLLRVTKATGRRTHISLPKGRVYVIKVGDKAVKVAL